jgi:hypothetical protein
MSTKVIAMPKSSNSQEASTGPGTLVEFPSSRPSKGSPVGLLMGKILEKYPDMSFEDARLEAHRLLDIAAGRKKYVVPPVLSPEEKERERVRLQSAFGKPAKSKDAA